MASESPLDPVEVERPFSHTEGRHGLFISGRAGGWGSYQLTGGRGQKPKSQWHDRTRQTIYATCERFVPKNIVKTVNFRRFKSSRVESVVYGVLFRNTIISKNTSMEDNILSPFSGGAPFLFWSCQEQTGSKSLHLFIFPDPLFQWVFCI